MKKLFIATLLTAVLGMPGYAEFIDTTAAQSDIVATAPSVPVEPPAPANSSANLGRHHVSLGAFGYFKSTADVFSPDFDHGTSQFLNYRYSFNDHLDLAVDIHAWGQQRTYYGTDVSLTCGGLGLGLRYTAPPVADRLFFYFQGNLYDAVEAMQVGSESASETGLGFGFNGGLELRLGRLISIPLDLSYLLAKPSDDISGYGISTGISINWGRLVPGVAAPQTSLPAKPSPGLTDTATTVSRSAEPATTAAGTITSAKPQLEKRHHLTAGVVGAFRPLSNDFSRYGENAQQAQCRSLNYRYSASRQVDLVMDGREWVSDFEQWNTRYTMRVRALGLGGRWYPGPTSATVRPYVQATICSITEQVETSYSIYYTKASARSFGLSASAGAEIRLSPAVSIPVELFALLGRPAENIGGIGITAGVSLHAAIER